MRSPCSSAVPRKPRSSRSRIAGARTVVSPVSVTPALLGRAVAGAEITELDGQLAKLTGEAADKLRAEIVQRSVAARVISSQTSMLVLESDADYARYGIDRRALAEILSIGPTGVELTHRALPAPAQIATPPVPPVTKKPEAKSGKKLAFQADDGDDDDRSAGKRKAREEQEEDEESGVCSRREAHTHATRRKPTVGAAPSPAGGRARAGHGAQLPGVREYG